MLAVVKEPVLVTAPTGEPVTLGETLKYLRLDHNRDDEEIGGLIAVAREEAQGFTGRQFLTATFRQDLDEFPCGLEPIQLTPAPLAAVSAITYYDTADAQQTLSASVYEVDASKQPGLVRLKDGQAWPATKCKANAVSITFTAGYGSTPATVPPEIRLAIKSLVDGYYDKKGDDQVARGLDRPGTAWRLLRPFRMNMIART